MISIPTSITRIGALVYGVRPEMTLFGKFWRRLQLMHYFSGLTENNDVNRHTGPSFCNTFVCWAQTDTNTNYFGNGVVEYTLQGIKSVILIVG